MPQEIRRKDRRVLLINSILHIIKALFGLRCYFPSGSKVPPFITKSVILYELSY